MRKYKTVERVVCESKYIIDSTHDLTLSEMRLMYLCLSNIYRKEGIDPNMFYEVDLGEYSRIFDIEENSAYQSMIAACSSFKGKTLVLKRNLFVPDAPEKHLREITWLTAIDYKPKERRIMLQWNPHFCFLLNKLGRENPYIRFYLSAIAKMKSANSIRLFRLLVKEKGKDKNKGILEKDLTEFKRLMGLDPTTYTVFDNLRRAIIVPSIDEINRCTEFNVSEGYETMGIKKVGVRLEWEIKEGMEGRWEGEE